MDQLIEELAGRIVLLVIDLDVRPSFCAAYAASDPAAPTAKGHKERNTK